MEESRTPDHPHEAESPRPLFWAGGVLGAFLVAEVILVFLWEPAAGRGLLSSVALEFVAAREAAFPLALAAGPPPGLVAVASVLQNLMMAALVFPLVARLLGRWRSRDHFLARRLRRLQNAALQRRAFITKWGPLGLFGFMLIPLLANGALVSAVVGRVCGIPTRYLVVPIVGATILVSFAWAFAYSALFDWTGRIDARIPALMAALLTIGLVAWAATDEWRERRRARRDGTDAQADDR